MGEELPDLSILRRCWPEYADPSLTHTVTVRGVPLGGPAPVVVAGPCTVESLQQTLDIAQAVRQAGASLMRGGAYKPRTSPHSFQGLGAEGLEILAEVRRLTGLGIVTEVLDPRLVERVASVADMLLKRGWSATLEEWLCAAEYIAKEGNRQIVLCERGVRACCHWSYARNVLDLNVIEPLRHATPLPVIVDPSHSTGQWSLVPAMSRAALAVGAHGLLIEVVGPRTERSRLRCDAQQGIRPEVLQQIVAACGGAAVPTVAELACQPQG